jgi:hypothetical protein
MYTTTEYSSPHARQPFHTPNHQADRITALESRIAQIDPRIVVSEHPSKRLRLDPDSKIEPSFTKDTDLIDVSFYGAGFKTGFFGPSSGRNAASYYPGIIKLVSWNFSSILQRLTFPVSRI